MAIMLSLVAVIVKESYDPHHRVARILADLAFILCVVIFLFRRKIKALR